MKIIDNNKKYTSSSSTQSSESSSSQIHCFSFPIHIKHKYQSLTISRHGYLLLFVILLCVLPLSCKCDEDYYKTLDIGRHATSRDIKKAFRRLASKYHPDKNPGDEEAHDKFVEINRAYEVLSDEDKRKVYNQYGEEGLKEHEKNQAARGGRRGGGIFDMFFNRGGDDENPEDKRGEDIEADIWLHLSEIYNGHIYDLSIFRQILCPHCFGNGADSDEDIHECRKCGGTGTIMERRQIGIGFVQQIQKTCPKCDGQGKIIKKQCRVCDGRGVHEGSHTYWVEIQRGTPNNYQLMLENEGDEKHDSKGGHVIFNIKTFKHDNDKFVRDEKNIDDLHYYMKINLLQSLIGYNINITHLDGHIVNMNNLPTDENENSEITKPLSIKTIEGEGMPIVGTFPTKFGDLHVHFEVVFPKTLSSAQKQGIAQLFS